jgi:hypothetical protein
LSRAGNNIRIPPPEKDVLSLVLNVKPTAPPLALPFIRDKRDKPVFMRVRGTFAIRDKGLLSRSRKADSTQCLCGLSRMSRLRAIIRLICR